MALVVKNLPANAGDIKDVDLIPGLGRFPGEGNDNLFQYSCLGNPMNRGLLWAAVHEVARELDKTMTKQQPVNNRHQFVGHGTEPS